ncbi:MAG: hypothetical protein ACYTFG_12310 [Planctomycetota bacterium]|jgi:hypothetical protein
MGEEKMSRLVLLRLYTSSDLAKAMRAAAALDARICPDDWIGQFYFQEDWTPDVQMARFDNGSGDHVFALFKEQGVIVKGFDHESIVSRWAREDGQVWPGIYEGAPAELLLLLHDPALEKDDVTFCLWRESDENEWAWNPAELGDGGVDGSEMLLSQIPLNAEEYERYASEYFENDFDLDLDRIEREYLDLP